jgi:predicted flap endonuclease-1-like 5' DNA nuclease
VNVREKLTPTEQALAWVIGLGILLAIIALILYGFGIVDNDDITISLLIVGLAIAILGIGAWLILVRPWTEFDDLKTPLYTNQHEPAHAGPASAAGAVAEAPAAEHAEAAPAQEAPAEPLPSRTAAEPAAAADDLTRIDGIGPKTAQALAAAGITRYEQVAVAPPEELQAAAHEHGSRVVTAESWPEQARALLGEESRDDLTVVEGIGPKSQEALYAAGIRTYAALAQARPDALRDILEAAKLKLLAPDTWPEQAGYLARGDLDGLQALQETLKGGRKV